MDVVCCGCQKKLGEKPGDGISHGICDDCISRLYPWMKKEGNNVCDPKQEAV